MNKSILAAVFCAGALLAAPSAFADGMRDASIAQSRSAVRLTKENGVAVYRAPSALLGGGVAPAKAITKEPEAAQTTVIVEHHYHSRIAHVRTQGFYSGHPGKSRRFTQGFYSGPVDKGRSSYRCAHD